MQNTFVTRLPSGEEEGDFLSLDLGTTNFRVLLSRIRPNAADEFFVKHFTVPTQFRRGQSVHVLIIYL